MNVRTGGPHLLLFERNQQVITLLTSELQLAGYECHTARTAVEVFDTIARHPVQLVLVNLAQAAAGRREFWVALDAQRRGRGVQVLTCRCTNLAGYGAEDPDERGRLAQPDIEVDGMLGVMKLVDVVRACIPTATTGSPSQVSRAEGSGVSLPPPPRPYTVAVPFPAAAPNSTQENQQPVTTAPPIPQQSASNATQTYTDKVRAIIYPSQPAWNPPGSSPVNAPASASALQPTSSESREESGLEQLSRMLRVQQGRRQAHAPTQDDVLREVRPEPQERPVSTSGQAGGDVPAPASATISGLPLRASPIQDLPVERAVGGQTAAGGAGEQPRQAYRPERSDASVRTPSSPYPAASMPTSTSVKAPFFSPSALPPHAPPVSPPYTIEPASPRQDKASSSFAREEIDHKDSNTGLLEQVRANRQGMPRRREVETSVASDNTLLDIVQSLPAMSSLPPSPPMLSGRATRSLGSVLLEGHLVPQNRLEVAQGVQRMLRGVDLNYQLGEILLMFKLLTPDQLLAASLVSYGLISTTQISALGRIRQELHSIGLEYDLENLLILFRILTPEQLREVRASWS